MAKGRTRQLSIAPGMDANILRLISEQRNINKEFDRRKPLTTPNVFNNNAQRPPAEDNGGRIIFVLQADGSFQGQFSDGATWNSFLASAVSFDTPAITYATTASGGSGAKTIRHNAILQFPSSIMSSASSSTLTLTDNATNQLLTGTLGSLRVTNPSEAFVMAKWNAAGDETDLVIGKDVYRISADSNRYGASLEAALVADLVYNNSADTYAGSKFCIQAGIDTGIGPTYSGITTKVAELSISKSDRILTGTNTFTKRVGIEITARGVRGATTTVTDTFGIDILNWPTVNITPGTYTNAASIKAQMPTVGSTIRRGYWLTSNTANVGTASANSEGFYCEDLTIGTSQRASFYSEGMTTGTPTDVYGLYQGTAHVVGTNRYGARFTGTATGTPTLAVGVQVDGHGVGTTKWAFRAMADESYMSGVQQDDNKKDVFGTGRDAEIYYDGTDLIIDPDVVGTGSMKVQGKSALNDDVTIADAKNIILNATTGTKIGTGTTQKLGLWNVAPVAQYATTGTVTGFTGTGGTAVTHSDTFTGNTGATAYTIGDVVRALKLMGIMLA